MQTPEQLAAELYDVSVPDWDGEINFYRELVREIMLRGLAERVLEVACGTGRVTLRLAQEGVDLVGVDLDEEMLTVARRKSEGMPNVRWVRGDMRSLDLGQTFGLIIVPGHSFQCGRLDSPSSYEWRSDGNRNRGTNIQGYRWFLGVHHVDKHSSMAGTPSL
jgi:SAM-dependent methyltransferase